MESSFPNIGIARVRRNLILLQILYEKISVRSKISILATLLFFLPVPALFAAIAQRGAAITVTTTTTTLSINKPAGIVAGDIMIVNIAQEGNNTTAPSSSGWTLINGQSLAGGTLRYGAVLYRIADGTEGSSFAFTLGTGTIYAAGAIVAFSGVNTTTPFDVTPGTISVQPNQTSVAATSITTVTANDAVIMLGMAAGSNPTWSGWTTTSPGALTELYDVRVGNNNDGASVGAAWAIKATAGTTGAGAATLSSSERNGGILLALRPASCTLPTTQASIGTFTSIGNNSVTVNWTRGSGDRVIVVARPSTTSAVDPVNGVSYTANASFSSGNTTGSGNYVVYNGTGNSVTVTNLSPVTGYTFTVYEYTSTSNCYLTPGSLSSVTTVCSPPSSQATAPTYTNNTTGTSLTVNWARGNGNGVVVVARLSATTSVDPVSGQVYTANAAFGSGSSTGTGNYVVYVGTGTSVNITGLSSATSYNYTVYEYNSTGPCYDTPGSTSAVATPCIPPVTQATILAYTNNTTGTSLTVNWINGSGTGGVIVVARLTSTAAVAPVGGTPYTANNSFGSGSTTGTGNFVVYKGTGTSVDVTNLAASTSYTFSVYAYNSAGPCYDTPGATSFVSTPCIPPSTQASIGAYTNISSTSLTVNWNRGNGTGGVIVVARLNSSASVDPTSGISYSANPVFGSGNTTGTGNYVVYAGSGTSVNVSGLTGLTAYTFTVYEYNSSSNCYLVPGSALAVTTTCVPPATQAAIGTYTNNTTGNSLSVNWTRGNGNQVIVVARLTATTAVDPVSGTSYSASSTFGSGNSTGSGNFVVYSGTGTSVNVTGLTTNTSYTFTVYEYNSSGTCYDLPGSSSAVTTPLIYCTPSVSFPLWGDGIVRVVFNTIDNSTGINGYTDYTSSQSTTVILGASYNLSVYINTAGNFTNNQKVWIDWNQDGVFNTTPGSAGGMGEEYDLGTAKNVTNGLSSLCPLNITVPPGATLGATRMRVSSKYNGYTTSCATGIDGEFEDYTIIVTNASPTITSFTPTNACVGSGTVITINGSNFVAGNTSVTINGVSASPVTFVNSSQITVPLPAAASGTGNIVVKVYGNTATSASTFTVNPLPSPTLESSDPDNTFCAGTSVTFTAGGGTNYNFRVNGTTVQNGASNTYTTSSLTNGQVVDVVVTNASGCSATSAGITNLVLAVPVPLLTSSDADNIFCAGTAVTFTASGGNMYNFRVDGISVQNQASTTYTTTSLTNGQKVDVIVTNASGCSATSSSITNTVLANPTPTLISSDPDNIFCAGTSVIFTAGGGTNYNFRVNGTSVQNGTSNVYTTASLTNGQIVDVVVSNSSGCSAVSAGIVNTVISNPMPVLTSSDFDNTFCAGTSVIFTASGGTSYNFRVNGVSVQNGTLATYTTTTLTNGQAVDVIVANSSGCSATSSVIVNSVNALPTATISGTSTICTGNSTNLTVNLTGTQPWNIVYTDGTTPVAVNGITSSPAIINVSPAVTTTYSLLSVNDMNCNGTYSGSAAVTVTPNTNSVALTSGVGTDYQNLCVNSTIATITYSFAGYTTVNITGLPSGVNWSSGTNTITISGVPIVSGTFNYQVALTGGTGICNSMTLTGKITVNAMPVASAGGSQNVCLNGIAHVSGASASNGSILWTHNGSGTLTDVTTLAPSYTPSAADAGNTVTLVMTVSNSSCAAATANYMIYVYPSLPVPTISGATSVCQNSTGNIYSTDLNQSNYVWSVNGGVITSGQGTSSVSIVWSNPGTQSVSVNYSDMNGCSASNPVSYTVAVNPIPTTSISYAGNPFCGSVGDDQPVTLTGTGAYSGGTYTASPSGLTINGSTGAINPKGSIPGTYTVTYTVAPANGCGTVTATTTVVITTPPSATINYSGSPFCNSVVSAQPVTLNGTAGGTYTASPSGLSINSSTGAITPSASAVGSYIVTYTIPASGGCDAFQTTKSVVVTAQPVATFSYAGSPYCSNASNPTPTFSGGGVAGKFTAPAGLIFVSSSTGEINMAASTPGTYTVTNTINAVGGCGTVTASNTITINPLPVATFSYSDSPYCSNESTASPTLSSGAVAGTFTATPTGLSLNATTGQINLSASTPGTYTVTNTVMASGGCSQVSAATTVTITALPIATFSYSGSPYCANATDPLPIFSGGGVAGTFTASSAGLVVDPVTGEINISSSTAGTYTVTNTIAAAGGCGPVAATYSVTLLPKPAITAEYCSLSAPKIKLRASGGGTYQWLAPLSGTSDNVDVDIAGVYGVTVTNGSCVQTVYSSVSDEMVVNGDFSNGNTGFISGYNYKPDLPGLVPARQGELYDDSGNNAYSITTNGQNVHINFWGTDHTNNSTGTRNFMAVNGHGTLIVWQEGPFTVVPGTTYYFSAWATSLNSVGPFANLQFNINGSTNGMTQSSTGVLPARPESNNSAPWTRFYGFWTVPTGVTSATLSIVDLETALTGNDFGIDDISFGTLEPPPSTLLSAAGTDAQTVCINSRIADIKYSTYKASSATVTGLPTGVTASAIVSNVITISGISTQSGTFTYTITLTGCGPDIVKTGTITVTPPASIASVAGISPLCIGSTAIYSANSVVLSGGAGSWSSDNTSVATVDISGVATGIGAGTCNIRYTITGGCGGTVSAQQALTINPNASVGSVTGSNDPICIGGTTTFVATGVALGGGTGSWSSSNTGIATVSNSGMITGVSAGTCTITFTVTGGCGGTVLQSKNVTVNPNASVASVTGASPICINGMASYSANSVVMSGGTGSWSSSNTSVATVDASGVVTGVGAGSCNIIYTVTSGCGGIVSAQQALIVSPNANAGVISGTSPVCIGNTPQYTSNGTSGGIWSTTNASVATVNLATGLVTAVGAGSCNIVYTLSGVCGSSLVAMKSITVNPNASVTSVTGTTPLCIGFTSNYIANGVNLGGNGSGAWSSSNSAIATVDASGVVKGISAGTCDIIYTITGGCGGTISARQSVVINPNSAISSVTGNTPLCVYETATYSANGAVLGGGVGTWSSSNTAVATVDASTGLVTAVNTGNCNIIYTITGGCSGVKTAQQSLTVNAHIWTGAIDRAWEKDGNWCGKVPTATTDVRIPASAPNQPLINAGIVANCRSITIDAGASVNISAGLSSPLTDGGSLNVANTITNNAGVWGLVVGSAANSPNGTLIFNNSPSSPVLATVEMYSKAYYDPAGPTNGKYKWQYFGIPLQGPMPPSPTCDGSYVRQNEESQKTASGTAVWINASTLNSFRGYEITQVSPTTLYFQGQLVNSNYAYPITNSASGAYPGNNILGNSYTAAIDVRKMTFDANTEAAVYQYNTGSFADWSSNNGGSANGSNPGQYTASTPGTAGNGGIPVDIPSMQGFLIKCTANATFTFNYSWVKDNASPQRVKAFKASSTSKIYSIIDVIGSRYGDRMWIFTDPSCSHTFDNGWDGRKFLGSSLTPQLYALEPDGNYQIDAVDDMNSTYLGFRPGEDASYTLTFTHTANTSNRYTQGIYLLDLVTNKLTSISQSGSEYSFTASSSDPEKRFEIITTGMSVLTDLSVNEAKHGITLFNIDKVIYVNNNSDMPGVLSIYDTAGRLLQQAKFGATGETVIYTQLPIGVYIAKATTNALDTIRRLVVKK